MPWERDFLAVSLRDVRRIFGGESSKHETADRRQFALAHRHDKAADLHIPATGCTPALLIRTRAAARLMGATVAGFVADALAAAVEAAVDAAHGRGLPYTRHERDALACLGESPEADDLFDSERARIAALLPLERQATA